MSAYNHLFQRVALLVFAASIAPARAITAKELCSYAPASQVEAPLGEAPAPPRLSGPEPDEDQPNAIG